MPLLVELEGEEMLHESASPRHFVQGRLEVFLDLHLERNKKYSRKDIKQEIFRSVRRKERGEQGASLIGFCRE